MKEEKGKREETVMKYTCLCLSAVGITQFSRSYKGELSFYFASFTVSSNDYLVFSISW